MPLYCNRIVMCPCQPHNVKAQWRQRRISRHHLYCLLKNRCRLSSNNGPLVKVVRDTQPGYGNIFMSLPVELYVFAGRVVLYYAALYLQLLHSVVCPCVCLYHQNARQVNHLTRGKKPFTFSAYISSSWQRINDYDTGVNDSEKKKKKVEKMKISAVFVFSYSCPAIGRLSVTYMNSMPRRYQMMSP